MFVTNPFAELEATVPPTIIQIYVAAISVLVAMGTQLLALIHTST